MRQVFYRGLLFALNNSVVNFGIGVMLLMAGTAISQGTFTVGDFALFVSYLWFTTQVPSEIGTFYGDYKTQAISIERLMELIRPEPPSALVEPHPIYDSGPLPEVTLPVKTPADRLVALEVRDLSYRYPASENGSVLQGVSFRLQRGDFVVITGRVGSGKSTLARILSGLLNPDSGEIRWNGQPVNDPALSFARHVRPTRLKCRACSRNRCGITSCWGCRKTKSTCPARSIPACWNLMWPGWRKDWIRWLAHAGCACLAGRYSVPRQHGCSCATPNCWCSTICPPRWMWRRSNCCGSGLTNAVRLPVAG